MYHALDVVCAAAALLPLPPDVVVGGILMDTTAASKGGGVVGKAVTDAEVPVTLAAYSDVDEEFGSTSEYGGTDNLVSVVLTLAFEAVIVGIDELMG